LTGKPAYSLESLKAFATTPLDGVGEVGFHTFADGDLGARVRFYGSALYKDFLEERSQALLAKARVATSDADRDELLVSLSASVQGIDAENPVLAKHVAWARALFHSSVPTEERIRFALASAAERVAFAQGFRPGSGKAAVPNWFAVVPVASSVEVLASLTVADFVETMDQVVLANQRKAINPLVGALADFRGELLLAANDDQAAWVRDLCFAACRSKPSATHFVAPQIGPETLPQEHQLVVAKALGRLWSTKSPAWTAAFRDAAAAAASKSKASTRAAAHEASQTAAAEAPEAAAAEAPEAAAAKALEASAAPAPDSAAESAPESWSARASGYAAAAAQASSGATTTARATPAAAKAVLLPAWRDGDLVTLDESVDKNTAVKRVRSSECWNRPCWSTSARVARSRATPSAFTRPSA